MLVAEGVTTVALEVNPGPPVKANTRRLSDVQARKARILPVTYLATGIRRDVCLERVSGFDKAGAEVLRTSRQNCVAPS
jgi:hypothetical protein